MFNIQQASNLPAMDWWNGLADPYVIVTAHVGGQQMTYRLVTKPQQPGTELWGSLAFHGPAACHDSLAKLFVLRVSRCCYACGP